MLTTENVEWHKYITRFEELLTATQRRFITSSIL